MKCTGLWRSMSPACKGLFVRYRQLDMDTPADIGKPITWDTRQLAVSYVYPIGTKLAGGLPKWLQFEWERNDEDVPAPGDDIPNDLFFVELFSAF
jgi:hypothetical protein